MDFYSNPISTLLGVYSKWVATRRTASGFRWIDSRRGFDGLIVATGIYGLFHDAALRLLKEGLRD